MFATLLAPRAPDLVDRVDFTGIHALALRLLRQRGIRPLLDPGAAENIFNIAYSKQPRDGALRSRDGVILSYWRDEVTQVIKGRGISSSEKYADLARIGRKRRLTYEQQPPEYRPWTSTTTRAVRRRRILPSLVGASRMTNKRAATATRRQTRPC